MEENYQDVRADKLVLTGDNYHHAVRVMRMKIGEHCFLVYQDAVALLAVVTGLEESQLILKEVEKEEQTKELPLTVTIASGYPKGDKLEWVVQKGTELGGHHFLSFPSEYSITKWDEKKRSKKQERLNKIAKEAAEQAHRQFQPQVKLFASFEKIVAEFSQYDHVLVAYEEAAKQGEISQFTKVLQESKAGEKWLFIFGPEGGFSTKEIAYLQEKGAKICGLGPRILRTETAPLYVLSAISYYLELSQ